MIGKHGDGGQLVPRSATSGCRDTEGWVDQYGRGCSGYEKEHHCRGGMVLSEDVATAEYRSPHVHCCACGGGAVPSCMDDPGWADQYGRGCSGYEKEHHCRGGIVLSEHIATAEYRSPHVHCCACGGGHK